MGIQSCQPGLMQRGACRAAGIHGDLDQAGRMAALADFRAGRAHVLVATDVASRGLDIKSVRTVVSLDAPRDIDTHVHRVGRTGRAGARDGAAHTLVTPAQAKFAGARRARWPVPAPAADMCKIFVRTSALTGRASGSGLALRDLQSKGWLPARVTGRSHAAECAGDLVASLAAANQEVPPALAELAARSRRGGLRGRKGGAGRGRGRHAVGGAGLGFGEGGAGASVHGGHMNAAASGGRGGGGRGRGGRAGAFEAGFARGGYESTVEGTAVPAGNGASSVPQPPPAAPPLLPAAPGPAQPAGGQAAASHAPQAAAPPPAAPAPEQQGVFGGGGLRTMYAGRFKTSFVASGTAGGDIGQRATIVAAKQAPARAVPPPPPVAALPAGFARPAPTSTSTPSAQAVRSARLCAEEATTNCLPRFYR